MSFRAPEGAGTASLRDALVPRIGSDLVTVSEIAESVATFGDRYLERIFTARELSQTGRSPERLGGRFAAKEAVIKVIRPARTEAVPHRDIEIVSLPSGAPRVRLHRLARAAATESSLGRIELSITHDHGVAFATAITLLHRKEQVLMNDVIRTVLDQHGNLSVAASSLGDTDDLYQVGLTSHATVNVMLALEEELDLEFSDDLMTRATFTSIASLEAAAKSQQA